MSVPHPPDYFQKKFGMSIHERAAKLMAEEIKQNPVPGWWYLSYAHESEGFKGGAIVSAHGFVGACDYARQHGITPGPDVQTQGHEIPSGLEPHEHHRNRLLTQEELEGFWGPMKTRAELEAEENGD